MTVLANLYVYEGLSLEEPAVEQLPHPHLVIPRSKIEYLVHARSEESHAESVLFMEEDDWHSKAINGLVRAIDQQHAEDDCRSKWHYEAALAHIRSAYVHSHRCQPVIGPYTSREVAK